jgi:hypothetical protein
MKQRKIKKLQKIRWIEGMRIIVLYQSVRYFDCKNLNKIIISIQFIFLKKYLLFFLEKLINFQTILIIRNFTAIINYLNFFIYYLMGNE